MSISRREFILAGDIGGTNTRLAIVEAVRGRFHFLVEQTFPSREEPSLESALRKFLSNSLQPITCACLGVAGPVVFGHCDATNLPWRIDSQEIARQFNLARVGLLNDLEAKAYGIAALEEKDFEVLNEGDPNGQGNRAVISPGTGLGEAVLFRENGGYRPFASEGGHADFAPRSRFEMDLLGYLLQRHHRVSAERLLSGQGLLNIYQFLRDTRVAEEPEWLAELMRQKNPPAVITENGVNRRSALCVASLDLFVSLYGAEAGNLALKVMATGGVYLGGGIVPRIVAKLKEPAFMSAFTDKGRLSPLLRAIPVRVILNPKVALLGAAIYAINDYGRKKVRT